MDIALGIVGSFLPLLILGGIIFGIVKLVTRRDNATSESAGVMIRRFFQYSIMLAMLVLVTFGLAGVLDAAASTSSRITQDSERTALSIAFLVVGLPVFAGLSIYTARRLTSDPTAGRESRARQAREALRCGLEALGPRARRSGSAAPPSHRGALRCSACGVGPRC